MRIQACKFYVNAPRIVSGDMVNDAKSTYFTIGPNGFEGKEVKALSYTIGEPVGTLQIALTLNGGEEKLFIYQLADILGRIEVTVS